MKICVLDAQTLGDDIDLSPLKACGEVVVYPLTSLEEIEDRVEDVDVIVTNKVLLNKETLKTAKKLKLIALTATGFNNVDLSYVKSKGIGVANVAGYSTQSVAQHTFAMLFSLLEQLSFYDQYVKTKAYAASQTFAYIAKPFYEINHKTWGIIGMGDIGKEVARLAEAFGAKIIYYSTSGKNNSVDYRRVSLEELLNQSEIISIHAPLNEQTYNLIQYKEIVKMKQQAIIMNLGRGGIINEADLAKALDENLIRGAALDVLEKEPIDKENPLYQVNDASKWLVTPHIAWASFEARTLLIQEVALNIQYFKEGKQRSRVV
ncbi:MAG: D-2-hydroxyacid dehydrogenase [Cellulosilyticaceae bacterium]